ncbi:sugar ABC transporter substrate-binding protein [Nesterenkonia lutea]|uniref:Ribose transport system substrate-binding protein n=1 Tax=Nesterenkonia lutea TaxID=272919 RepID=A0ABR9JG72_9MICC|nr:sugar ABC transporter substrate-binding protein [Nesterenkonia lutea]MBE1524930.1 ribose transport system substrate-binding protein [Nesterenkonia lutea]
MTHLDPTAPSRRRTLLLATALTAGMALSACSGPPEEEASAAAGDDASTEDQGQEKVDKILFSYPFNALPVYSILTEQAKEYAADRGVEVVFTNDNMDLGQQVSNLTTYLDDDSIDAAVVFPADPASLDPIAAQYMDAGKHWVTYGGDLENQDATLQFSFEESGCMLAEDAAKWAGETLDGEGTALVLIDETIQIGQERTDGILDCLEESAPGLEVVTQQSVTPGDGLSATNTVLAQNPDIDIVLSASGDAAQGAYQALVESGRATDDENTYLGGLDGNGTLFASMKEGSFVRGIVTAAFDELGAQIIDLPIAVGEGEAEAVVDLPAYLVTAESEDLDDYIEAFGGAEQ